VKAGALWLSDNLPAIDAHRIGVHGLSYGGINTLQALARDSAIFAAGVANAPVFNWVSTRRFEGSILFNLNPTLSSYSALPTGPLPHLASPQWEQSVRENVELAWQSSPAAYVSSFTSPVLVIHGDLDRDVDFQESIGLVRSLKANGHEQVETFFLPGEKHWPALFANQVRVSDATVEFFVRRLT
jgi:dipeptidyl aminopeptidase/acylaminoacyl peptidase